MYLDKVLETLNDSGLDYCIQNGYEDMPYSYPSDIDIFYKGATEKELDEIVKTAATNANLRVLQKIAMGYYHFVYWLSIRIGFPIRAIKKRNASLLYSRQTPET